MTTFPLVSIISPCYNGEGYLKRFLDSCLAQTYQQVEFIFINDGSTDKTEEIFLSYQPLLQKKGWKVIYLWQENAGCPAAINKGVPYFTGEYLIWPDSDDILYPQHIEKKVRFMQAHTECDVLFSRSDVALETDLQKIIGQVGRKCPQGKDTLFADLIEEKNVFFAPIGFMVRTTSFLKSNPQRHIYDKNTPGQNAQMLLPVCLFGTPGYIEEPLACYIVRAQSQSHHKKNPINRLKKTEEGWEETIKRLPLKKEEIRYWIKRRRKLYYKAYIFYLLTYLLGEKKAIATKNVLKKILNKK